MSELGHILQESIVFPRFPKVKDLTLILGAWDDDSILIMYASLLEQCPYLENFQLQVNVLTIYLKRKMDSNSNGFMV